MRAEITRARINSLQPRPGKDTWLWDVKISGFGVKVTMQGIKSYYFQYRMGGRSTPTRRLFLGRCEWMSLEEARVNAAKSRNDVFYGVDPFDERKRKRVEGASFKDVASAWLDQKIDKREQGRKENERIIHEVLCPALKNRQASSITERDIQAILDQYSTRQPQGNRVLGVLRQVFKYARKPFGLANNPATDIERYQLTSRERYLFPDELRRFFTTLDDCEKNDLLREPFLDLIRLLLFTGCRKDEIRLLQWRQINLSDKSLRLHTAKTGPRTVVLNSAAVEVIQDIPRSKNNLYVIVSPTGNGYLKNTSRPWKQFCELAGLEDFHIHDLRHTFASIGGKIDITMAKMGKLLGHAHESMTAKYTHLPSESEREASELIAQAIRETVKDSGNE